MRKANLLVVGALSLGFLLSGCSGDPNDPRTWARKLSNLRDQKEALDQLAKMSVERAQQALPELVTLYKETKKPEHLEALTRFKADATKPPAYSLAGQQRYDEAEPLLVSGYEGMKQRQHTVGALNWPQVREAGKRLVRFYDSWSKPEKAAEWRKSIADLR